MLRLYQLVATGLLTLYGASGLLGLEIGSGRREKIAASARTSPGGYRSAHFWHTGFHGGK
jgi:hypothetical protein